MKIRFAVVALSGVAGMLPLSAQPGRASFTPQFRVHIIDRNFEGITGGGISQTGLADLDGDGCVDIVTKPWTPSPNNAVGGSAYVLFMHNVSSGCK
jgi:hypothetical protein